MSDIEIHEYKDINLENAMVIVSFPTAGFISTIVANHMVEKLDLERIGAISSDEFYPAAIIHDGQPTPPVRIFAGEHTCGPNSECNQLVIIVSELPLKTLTFAPFAEKILDWCEKKKCKLLLTIEGISGQKKEEKDQKDKVFHVASTQSATDDLKKLNTKHLTSGMVSGLSGILLYKGNLRDFNVISLLTNAQTKLPDSRAAASVLGIIDKMLPQINLDPKPLLEQAKDIEEEAKKAVERIRGAKQKSFGKEATDMYA